MSRGYPSVFFLLFLLISAPLCADDPLHDEEKDQWASAYSLQLSRRYEEAARVWEDILARPLQSHSSAAHYNLGLCCIEMQRPECVSLHWLESIKSSHSLGRLSTILPALSQYQRSLGLVSVTTESPLFVSFAYVGETLSFFAWTLAAWLLLAALVGLGKSRRVPRFFWAAAAVLVFVLGGAGYLMHQQSFRFRVIGKDAEVPIYASSTATSPVSTLPGGTVVLVDAFEEKRYHIRLPLPGWISVESFLNLPNESAFPAVSLEAEQSALLQ